MSLAAPGRPAAPARLLSQRRRAALVAAGLFRIRLRCAEASSEPVAAEAVAGGGRA